MQLTEKEYRKIIKYACNSGVLGGLNSALELIKEATRVNPNVTVEEIKTKLIEVIEEVKSDYEVPEL